MLVEQTHEEEGGSWVERIGGVGEGAGEEAGNGEIEASGELPGEFVNLPS